MLLCCAMERCVDVKMCICILLCIRYYIRLYVNIYICIHIHMYIHIHIHIRIYTYLCRCMFIYPVYVYINIYIYACIIYSISQFLALSLLLRLGCGGADDNATDLHVWLLQVRLSLAAMFWTKPPHPWSTGVQQ